MRFTLILLLVSVTSLNAQSVDYNLKKGYVAEGYDVVEYFKNNAIEGKKSFTATHDNVKYKFVSQKNLDIFLNSPEKYIPQYGGYCAYAVAIDSKKISVDAETFEIRDGKLYLFYNSWGINTLKKWKKNNVKGLQKKADQNWEAIKN